MAVALNSNGEPGTLNIEPDTRLCLGTYAISAGPLATPTAKFIQTPPSTHLNDSRSHA